MKVVFDSTTLAHPDQLVGESPYTRRMLLSAILELFANNSMVFVGVSEEKAPYVTAFGIYRVDGSLGYGLKVDAAPCSCGTGIIFEVSALANYGRGWHTVRELLLPPQCGPSVTTASRVRWSTSEKLLQFGNPQTYPARHLAALKHTVMTELDKRRLEDEAQQQLRWLSEKLDTTERGDFQGLSYSGKVIPAGDGPRVTLSIQSHDVHKIVRIVDILNESSAA